MIRYKYIFMSFFSLLSCYTTTFSKHFILIAPPGSGKGTFANYMAKKYGYVHIGAGDIYRQRVDKNLPADYEILDKIFRQKILLAIKNKQNFILDNAILSKSIWLSWRIFFNSCNLKNDICFIVLEASDQTCISRMKNRLICKKCFNVCRQRSNVSLKEQKCKECGHLLSIRPQDHSDKALKQRFTYYHQTIDPIIKELEQSFCTIKISSEQPIETLYSIYDNLHNL